MSRICAAILAALLAGEALSADWPAYRADAGRTSYTSQPLPAKLSLRWTYRPAHKPRPAWKLADTRMSFDRAFHPVIAGGMLCFGSSADGKVYALDAATGRAGWTFFTGGPVRFAPVMWKDGAGEWRLYVASDDGCVYCLAAADGAELWKRRGGPGDDLILGNGRMISRWPARGGPVVVGGTVYFAAGIWPSEGIYVYALDAASGNVLWCNDKAGSIRMLQPHGGAWANSGISAQGYLAAAADRLLIPTGRGVPAALNRKNGKLQYFHLNKYGKFGGASLAAIENRFFSAGRAFDAADGNALGALRINTDAMAVTEQLIIHASRRRISALDRAKSIAFREVEKVNRRGKRYKVKQARPNVKWSLKAPHAGTSLIVAGNTIVSAGGPNVSAIDMQTRKVVWTTKVDGDAVGLAVADGRLYVSTNDGAIYCFDGDTGPARTIQPPPPASPYGSNADCVAAAKEIIRRSGIAEGWCLDLGCGDGRLTYELAKRTHLRIIAVDADRANVAAARRKLDAAGLYGVRVCVFQADVADTPLPNYFADLIVSARSITKGPGAVSAAEVGRVLRPCGGLAVLGSRGAMVVRRRGPLPGAGQWTHQYANPANTGSSGDAIVRAPLKMLWFDEPYLNVPNRHGRAPAPLFAAGRVFVEGINAIRAVSAYNGRVLWEYPLKGIGKPYHAEHLMGTAGTNSNFCTDADGRRLFVAFDGSILRIDAASGKKLGEYPAPAGADGKPGTWGYVACIGRALLGSLADEKHKVGYRFHRSDMSRLFTESKALLAIDIATGRCKWTYEAKHSIRHNAIAAGAGRVFLIDRPLAAGDRKPGWTPMTYPHPTGTLLALDDRTGRVLWKDDRDIWGTVLIFSAAHDVLLMCRQPTACCLTSEHGGGMRAFRASDGSRLWDVKTGYSSRPVLVGRTIYAQPRAYDLVTGKIRLARKAGPKGPVVWRFGRAYGCGIISACPGMLLFRSGTLGYLDLMRDLPTANYGGIRPGCWINTIPAGGIVSMPDSTNVCTCSYLIKASIALQPAAANLPQPSSARPEPSPKP